MPFYNIAALSKTKNITMTQDASMYVSQFKQLVASELAGGKFILAIPEEMPSDLKKWECYLSPSRALLVAYTAATIDTHTIQCCVEVYQNRRFALLAGLMLPEVTKLGISSCFERAAKAIKKQDEEDAKQARENEFISRTIANAEAMVSQYPSADFVNIVNRADYRGLYVNNLEIGVVPADNYGVVIYDRLRVRSGWLITFQRQIGFLYTQISSVHLQNNAQHYEVIIYFNPPVLVEGWSRQTLSHNESPLKPAAYNYVLSFHDCYTAAKVCVALRRCVEMRKNSSDRRNGGREELNRVQEQVRQFLREDLKPNNQIRM